MLSEANKSFTAKVNTILTNLIANKLSLVVLILSLLWVTLDAFNRLIPRNVSVSDIKQATNIVALVLPQLSVQTLSQLTLAYQPYKSDNKQNTNKVQGMSAAEQAKQQGLLKSLFIDTNKIELKAVIRNQAVNSDNTIIKQLTALLLVTDTKLNKSRIEQFNNNSLVYGYRLSIKNNTQVALVKQQKQGEQKVILTMYETRETRKLGN